MKESHKWDINPERGFRIKKVRIGLAIIFHTKQLIFKN